MGMYDDEDEGFNLKMVPRPGAQVPNGAVPEARKMQQAQTRGVLGQSDDEVQNAQSGWREALQRNIGQPIEDVLKSLNSSPRPSSKGPNEFGIDGGFRVSIPKEPSKLPSSIAQDSGMDMQPTQDLYELMMQEREKMLNRGLDPNTPENLQRFQKLREAFLKQRGG